MDCFGYSSMIDGLGKQGRLDKIAGLISQMVKCRCKLNYVCNPLIYGFIQASRLDYTVQFFRAVDSTGYPPSIVSYNILISGLCKAE